MIEEKTLPMEEDPQFVVVRMIREVEDYYRGLGLTKCGFDDVREYLQELIAESREIGIEAMMPERRAILEEHSEWIDYCCEGAEAMAAFCWIQAKKMLAPVLDEEGIALLEILSPMSMDLERSEFILSVSTAEQAREILAKCGHEIDKAVSTNVGGRVTVMLWDDDLGIWTNNAA